MLIVKRIHTKQGIYRLICVLEQKYRGFQPIELNSWLHSHVHYFYIYIYMYTSTYNNNIYNHIYIYICYRNLRMLYIYCRLLIFSYPKQSPGDHHGPGRSLGGWAMLLALLQGVPSGIPDPQKTTVDTKSRWKWWKPPMTFSESSWLFFFLGGAILLGRTIDISTSCCVVYMASHTYGSGVHDLWSDRTTWLKNP